MEQKFNELHPDYQGPSCGYDEKFKQYAYAYNEITFPKIEEILNMFIRGMHNDHDEFEYTHSESFLVGNKQFSANSINAEGYIKKGIQLGLRPEFAIFCGLHETDPRAIDEPYLFDELWFTIKSPHSAIDETIIPFTLWLSRINRRIQAVPICLCHRLNDGK